MLAERRERLRRLRLNGKDEPQGLRFGGDSGLEGVDASQLLGDEPSQPFHQRSLLAQALVDRLEVTAIRGADPERQSLRQLTERIRLGERVRWQASRALRVVFWCGRV